MKHFLEFLGVIALIQALGAFSHEIFGKGWGFISRIGFVEGHEGWAGAALVLIGAALLLGADRVPSGAGTKGSKA